MVFTLISFLPPVISPPVRKEITLFVNNYNLSGGEFYPGIFGDFITGRDTYIGPRTVTATITDNLQIVDASLFYSTDATFTEIPMVNIGGDVYSAVIPEQPPCTPIKYFIQAIDDCGNIVTDPSGAPDAPAGCYFLGVCVDDDNVAGPWLGTKSDPFQYIQDGIDAAAHCGWGVNVAEGIYHENIEMRDGVKIMGGWSSTFTKRYPGTYISVIDGGGSTLSSNPGEISEAESTLLTVLSQCIEDAIDAARYGDPLDIAMGKYDTELSPEEWIKVQECWNLIFELADHEILEDETNSSVVTAGSGVTSSAVIDGFKITGGYPAGIYCYNSSPIISNNTIIENSAIRGGGIYCHTSPAIITNNIIKQNNATFGGGICSYYCSPEITDNVISLNVARTGGGIFNYEASPLIARNTIIENRAEWGNGGGVENSSNSLPLISNNTINENTASSAGGGIMVGWSSHPTITNNTISFNSAGYAGGIFIVEHSSASLINNVIAGNTSGDGGGGVYLQYYSSSDIINNTIVGNYAEIYGGGIYIVQYSSATIKNNIISSNRGPDLMSPWWGIVCVPDSQAEIAYSDVWDNGGNYYGCSPGIGCISADPLFVDPAADDYHLQVGSQCIDAGDPDPAYNDPDGTKNDMGAYGGPGAMMSP